MKGKEAARAAARRAADLGTTVGQLNERLRLQASRSHARIADLEAEVIRLRSEMRAEAARLAAEEVERRSEEARKARNAQGMSDDMAVMMLLQKDKFVMNACRYLSMTLGQSPRNVLPLVMTWMTDKEWYGFGSVDLLVELGLPADGWVARTIKINKFDEKGIYRANRRAGTPLAVPLDHAEENGFEQIHSNYRASWYPKVVHGGIELTDAPKDER